MPQDLLFSGDPSRPLGRPNHQAVIGDILSMLKDRAPTEEGTANCLLG